MSRQLIEPAPFSVMILTAGRSRRMGAPKAWLRLGGESLLERIGRQAVAGGAHRLIAVVGSAGAQNRDAAEAGMAPAASDSSHLVGRDEAAALLRPLAEAGSVEIVMALGRPERHQIDSIRAGLEALPAGDALLLWPIDHPFADAALVRRLVTALNGDRTRVAVPVVRGRRAHPVLLGYDVARELESAAAEAGARGVVHARAERVSEVACADERLLAELNSPEQAAACGLLRQQAR